jgi:alkaline phosphatase
MKYFLTLVLCATFFLNAGAQQKVYTVADAHSHNDYAQPHPFITAYNEAFGSIEADIFLWHDSLIVGHNWQDTSLHRTLQQLYLEPLKEKVQLHNGYPYEDSSRSLQILIDIKTDSVKTLSKLVEILNGYPELIQSHHIYFVISGNRPAKDEFTLYPSFIWFDGDMQRTYNEKALSRIVMMSDNLKNYTDWNGQSDLTEADKQKLATQVEKIHQLKKKIRFWNAPDNPQAWQQLMKLQVDYINTDHIRELSGYFKTTANEK